MLQFPSPIRHRSIWGSVFVFLLFLSALCSWTTGNRQPPVATPAFELPLVPAAPSQPTQPGSIHWLSHEISLQQTLDSMGFTVNVPRTYHGHTVLAWNGYRISDRSDAIDSGEFLTDGSIQVREISMQSMLGPETTLGFVTDSGRQASDDTWSAHHPGNKFVSRFGHQASLLEASGQRGNWFSRTDGRTASALVRGVVSFYIDHPNAQWGPGSQDRLYSTQKEAQLLLLPAKTGGHWVQTAPNVGHWEGGAASGRYLFCWEDLVNGDHDYQDMVYLVGDIRAV